ncbi:MAG: HU family DNA-binding protein [Muribaculaceae bacterium]|nr:HU family DNA-binding protein [Muribaculaceae bacterium]
MNAKITFPELVQLVTDATSTTPRMSELFLKELFATISQALIDGQNVTIKNLGSFQVVSTASRGSDTTISKVQFTPDKSLAETLNQPFAAFEPMVLSDQMTDEMLQSVDGEITPTKNSEQSENAEPSTEPLGIMAPVTPPPLVDQEPEPQPEPEPEPQPEPEPEPQPEPEPEQLPEPEPVPLPEPEPEPQPEPEANRQSDEGNTADDTPTYNVQHYLKAEHESEKRKIAHSSFLKGMVTGVLATLALGAIVWGAWNGGRNSVLQATQPAQQADTLAETTPQAQQHPAAKPAATPTADATAHPSASTADVVTDTCTTTMYLSKMSIKHYGKPDFWVYIYEENRAKISDPNNVPPGTVVVIPPASKYGIDAHDKASVDRARRHTYDLFSGR